MHYCRCLKAIRIVLAMSDEFKSGESQPSESPPALGDDAQRLPGVPPAMESPDGPDYAVEPLTVSLLARFFGVPLLIIGTIVGGAVVVVFLFGAPSTPTQHTVGQLLQALESSSGRKTMGMLLPREKELWQTGLELVTRLKKKETEFTEDDLRTVATRVGAMVEREVRDTVGGSAAAPGRSGASGESRRLEFLILALGLSEQKEAVGPLITALAEGNEEIASLVMMQLGNLSSFAESREAKGLIVDRLGGWKQPETKLVACAALSALAEPQDTDVIDALEDLRLASEGEVEWAAGIALGRLGSPKARLTLQDLLDRSFWEAGERVRLVDDAGHEKQYPMPSWKIEAWLVAAIDAASQSDDADLWKQIDELKSDSSPNVRTRAERACSERIGPAITKSEP